MDHANGTAGRKHVVAFALLAAAGAGATVLALTDGAREQGDLSALDPTVASAANATRSPLLTPIAKAVTFLGGPIGLSIIGVAFLVWLLRRRAKHAAVLVGAALVVKLVLGVVLKMIVARVRPSPDLVLGRVALTYAFPSGHTLNSTVMFGLLAGAALIWRRSHRARVAAVITAALAAICVGLSRIYLGPTG